MLGYCFWWEEHPGDVLFEWEESRATGWTVAEWVVERISQSPNPQTHSPPTTHRGVSLSNVKLRPNQINPDSHPRLHSLHVLGSQLRSLISHQRIRSRTWFWLLQQQRRGSWQILQTLIAAGPALALCCCPRPRPRPLLQTVLWFLLKSEQGNTVIFAFNLWWIHL